MKFYLDTMLGHLVTWLRLLGYDTEYTIKEMRDEEILMKALQEDRVLVTRDRTLAQRARKMGLKTILLETTDTVKSLRTIAQAVGIDLIFDKKNSRCPECNSKLNVVSETPPRWLCFGCGKEYWVGGHWKNIGKTLALLEAIRDGG